MLFILANTLVWKIGSQTLMLHVWSDGRFGLSLEENRQGNWKLLQSLSHALRHH